MNTCHQESVKRNEDMNLECEMPRINKIKYLT